MLSGLAILPGDRVRVSLQPTLIKPAYDSSPRGVLRLGTIVAEFNLENRSRPTD